VIAASRNATPAAESNRSAASMTARRLARLASHRAADLLESMRRPGDDPRTVTGRGGGYKPSFFEITMRWIWFVPS
jgi:hypothetical protein